uniref:Inducible T cell costimulator ligand n=1 Tax=Sphenodon punctatus TaxID=8508 RepID=A0A8D0G9W2_SPHPU
MEKGDFSLLLLDISPKDEDTYRCIIQRNSTYFHVIHQDEVKLSIAGNYSQPILGESRENTDPGEERTLTCTSSNGYPEPNIYWINQTDGSFLDSARTEFIPNTDGTYNVSSTLKIKITRDVRIECTIENEQLVQNLTSFYTCDPDTDTKTQIDSKPGAKVASVIAVVILIIVLVILTSWLLKRKSAQLKSYAGVQRIEDGRLDNSYV